MRIIIMILILIVFVLFINSERITDLARSGGKGRAGRMLQDWVPIQEVCIFIVSIILIEIDPSFYQSSNQSKYLLLLRAPKLAASTGAYLLGLMPPELVEKLDLHIPTIRRDPHWFVPTLGNTPPPIIYFQIYIYLPINIIAQWLYLIASL